MAKVTPNWDVPNPANNFRSDVNYMRENNQYMLLMGIAMGSDFMLPQWTTAWNGSDKSKPDNVTMTKGSVIMRWRYTWSATDRPTQIIWELDRGLGDGYEIVDGGTITPSFNGADEPTGATSA